MKNVLVVVWLIIGFGIGYAVARYTAPPHYVDAHFDPVGDMIVAAGQGDHLRFYDDAGKPMAVTFKYGSQPCTAGDPGKGTCTLKDNAVYFFDCAANGCNDPAVGGGDYTLASGALTRTGHLDPPYASPKSAKLRCDPATSRAVVDPVTGRKGDGFAIQIVGYTQFTATFPAGTCLPSDTLNAANPTCRIQTTVTQPTPVSYSVSINGCQNPGTGALTVNP